MSKAFVLVGWDDIPHLTAQQKKDMLASIPPWQRDARSKGTPSLGSGAIYPIPEEDVLVTPFEIPRHWPRGYGLDVGWNRTAAIWLAFDPETDAAFAYDEYYRGQTDPAVHARGIKAKGEWMQGVIDPASRGARGHAGDKLLDVYRNLGMHLELADNAVMAGLTQTWDVLSTGQLKIFRTLQNTRSEMRLYRRDERGEVVKENDHLMDALRYAVMSLRPLAKVPPTARSDGQPWFHYTPPNVWSG